MSRSYYYNRAGDGEIQFGLNDLEALASPLGVDAFEIMDLARRETSDSAQPVDEVGRRVRLLLKSPRENGADYSFAELQSDAQRAGVELQAESFDAIAGSTIEDAPSDQVLRVITRHWSVPDAFLTDLGDELALEAALAQLDFRRALRETGASVSAARAVGDVPPTALRAIAESLRSIPPMGPPRT